MREDKTMERWVNVMRLWWRNVRHIVCPPRVLALYGNAGWVQRKVHVFDNICYIDAWKEYGTCRDVSVGVGLLADGKVDVHGTSIIGWKPRDERMKYAFQTGAFREQ